MSDTATPWTVACQTPLFMGFSRILEGVAISSSRRSSQPRDWTRVSYFSCIAGGFFTDWAIVEVASYNPIKQRPSVKGAHAYPWVFTVDFRKLHPFMKHFPKSREKDSLEDTGHFPVPWTAANIWSAASSCPFHHSAFPYPLWPAPGLPESPPAGTLDMQTPFSLRKPGPLQIYR